jgi:sterol desaturase/sphingolipid hydroxylase (fatty acid hydroxylase superfamily)
MASAAPRADHNPSGFFAPAKERIMTLSRCQSVPFRNACRFLAVLAVSLCLTYAAIAAWQILCGLWQHQPIDFPVSPSGLWNSVWPVLLPVYAGTLALDVAINGWRRSDLRRLLREDQPSDRTDLFYVAIGLTGMRRILRIVASLGLIVAVERIADPDPIRIAAGLPLWLAVPLAYVADDFFSYWAHRALHTRLLWPFHAVHHAAEDLSVLTNLRHHPAAGAIAVIISALPFGLLGFDPRAVAIANAISWVHTSVLHSTLPFPMWLEAYIAGPRAHRIHHARDAMCRDRNFGIVMLWDRLFGTYLLFDAKGLRTGIDDPLYQSGRPIAEMFLVIQRAAGPLMTLMAELARLASRTDGKPGSS